MPWKSAAGLIFNTNESSSAFSLHQTLSHSSQASRWSDSRKVFNKPRSEDSLCRNVHKDAEVLGYKTAKLSGFFSLTPRSESEDRRSEPNVSRTGNLFLLTFMKHKQDFTVNTQPWGCCWCVSFLRSDAALCHQQQTLIYTALHSGKWSHSRRRRGAGRGQRDQICHGETLTWQIYCSPSLLISHTAWNRSPLGRFQISDSELRFPHSERWWRWRTESRT